MLAPFRMVCRDFILPEPASYVFFYAIFNLRNLLYIILAPSMFDFLGVERPPMTKPREKTREELQAEIEGGKEENPAV